MLLRLSAVSVFGSGKDGKPVPLLEGIDFELRPGEWVNLVGVNGSGKSTLARLLSGLHVEGAYGRMERGFAGPFASPVVLQRPESQLFGETPREEIGFVLEWRQTEAERIPAVTERLLAAASLRDTADRKWELLSGGQRQLAAAAAAAAAPSPLLVFDEATAMLDDVNRSRIMALARERHREGTAVVWVTQRLEEIGPDDRTVALADGRIRFDGPGRAFFYGGQGEASPCLDCGLRLPYMAALAMELRRRGCLADPLPLTDPEWRGLGIGGTDLETRPEVTPSIRRIRGLRLAAANEQPKPDADEIALMPGTLTLVMGPNGAGKTVLLEKTAGLRDPEGLTVRYGTERLWRPKRLFPGERLHPACLTAYGYAVQSPEHALFMRSLEEELRYSLHPYGASADGSYEERIDRALRAVGWSRSRLSRDPFRMSGGERRRAALASVFATPAPWLLLDEPTAGLDRDGHRLLAAYFEELKREGRGVLLVSHDSDWALPFADRVLLMLPDGKVLDCRPEELADNPHWLTLAGMPVPLWLRAIRGLRRNAADDTGPLWTPEAAAEAWVRRDPLRGRGIARANGEAAAAKFTVMEAADTPPGRLRKGKFGGEAKAAHRLSRFDPRSVWLGYVLLSVSLFSLHTYRGILFGALVGLTLLIAGRIPVLRWRGLLAGYAIFGLLTAAFAGTDFAWNADQPVRWHVGVFAGTLLPFTRTMAVMLLGLSLPLMITPLALRRALERTVSRKGRTPPVWRRVVLTITLTLRFVPVLLQEWERFRRIFLARGKETGLSPRSAVRRLRGTAVPLLLSLFRLADEAALALESRGVRKDAEPARVPGPGWKKSDTALVAGAAVLAVLVKLIGERL